MKIKGRVYSKTVKGKGSVVLYRFKKFAELGYHK